MQHTTHSRALPGSGGKPYVGDLYDPEMSFRDIAVALSMNLAGSLPHTVIKIVRRVNATGRGLEISVIEHDQDLADPLVSRALCAKISDEANRFGYDRSHYATDLIDRHFAVTVEIHPDYWAKRQASKQSTRSSMTPSAFMGSVKRGDRFEEIRNGRVAETHVVTRASASRFETTRDGSPHGRAWKRPSSKALVVHGDRVRIAQGDQNNPDAHVELVWSRSK